MDKLIDALAAPVIVSICGYCLAYVRHAKVPWMGAFAAYFCGYALLLEYAGNIPDPFGGHLSWIGKIATCGYSLVSAAVLRFSAFEIGLVLPGGRVRDNLAGIIVAMILAGGVAFFFSNGPWPSLETWLFQTTMPGLDEELAFRGIGLACLLRAFGNDSGRFYAAAISTLLFGVGHGLGFDHGTFTVQWTELFYTSAMGAVLMSLRLRTGSLLGPVLAHNLGNLSAYWIACSPWRNVGHLGRG